MRLSLPHHLRSLLVVLTFCGCMRGGEEQPLGRGGVIPQSQRNTCGPAALAMLLSSEGIAVSVDELERRMQPGHDGVSLTTIIATAREYGVHLEAWRLPAGALDTLKAPAILWIDMDHFVVFDSLTAAGIYLRDPASGRIRISRQGLSTRWDGAAAVQVRTP